MEDDTSDVSGLSLLAFVWRRGQSLDIYPPEREALGIVAIGIGLIDPRTRRVTRCGPMWSASNGRSGVRDFSETTQ